MFRPLPELAVQVRGHPPGLTIVGDCATVVVQPGHTLSKIATEYDISDYRDIYSLNKDTMVDIDTIVPGQVLKLPGGDCVADGAGAPGDPILTPTPTPAPTPGLRVEGVVVERFADSRDCSGQGVSTTYAGCSGGTEYECHVGSDDIRPAKAFTPCGQRGSGQIFALGECYPSGSTSLRVTCSGVALGAAGTSHAAAPCAGSWFAAAATAAVAAVTA